MLANQVGVSAQVKAKQKKVSDPLMKYSKLNLVPIALQIAALSLASFAHLQSAFAVEGARPTQAVSGTNSGGGGDASEMRVDAIRADILHSVEQGGYESLDLPPGITQAAYRSAMLRYLAPLHVVVGFVTQAEQYRLIHHEFAGLARMEQNQGAASDYSISSQITAYLVSVTRLQLSVRRRAAVAPTAPPGSSVTDLAMYGLVGTYAKTTGTGNCPLSVEVLATGGGRYFQAQLKIRQLSGDAHLFEDWMSQERTETGYSYSEFYTAYRNLQTRTFLDSNSGYIVRESGELVSDLPGIIRWAEGTPANWYRETLNLKKLDNGDLHLSRTIDTAQTANPDWGGASTYNCRYRAL